MKKAARDKQDRVRYRDCRAKEKQKSRKHIAAILRNAAAIVAACLVVVLMGCYEIDDILVTVEPTTEEMTWEGEVVIELDNGNVERGRFTMVVLPPTSPDPDIPQPPEIDLIVPTEEVGVASDPIISEEVTQVWVTPTGTKFHWICDRYTGTGNGNWIEKPTAIANGKTPCSYCLSADENSEEDI